MRAHPQCLAGCQHLSTSRLPSSGTGLHDFSSLLILYVSRRVLSPLLVSRFSIGGDLDHHFGCLFFAFAQRQRFHRYKLNAMRLELFGQWEDVLDWNLVE
ncbi:hypothetical protein PM082_019256 [Marasmius tenuissimus]|nr:hypothetical protein PM082_019256 [Marasmius tenuissimus]